MRANTWRLGVLLLLFAATTGCISGARGRYGFIRALAADGSVEEVFAAGGARGSIPYFKGPFASRVASARSTDPSVFRVTHSDSIGVDIVTGDAGHADLVLLAASGREIDRCPFRVEDIDRVTVDPGWGQSAGPTVLTGIGLVLHVRVWHGAEPLAGIGAVRFTVEPPLRRRYGGGDLISVGTGSPSTARLTIQAGSAHLSVPIRSVDPGAVTSLRVTTPSVHVAVGDEAPVDIRASVGDQPLYNPACDWSSEPAGLTFDPDGMVDAIRWRTHVGATAPGTYQATCSLGHLRASVTVIADPRGHRH